MTQLASPKVGKFKGLIGAVVCEVNNLVTLDLNAYGRISLPADQVKYVKPIKHDFVVGDKVFSKALGVCTIDAIVPNGMIWLTTAKGQPASAHYSDIEKYNPLEHEINPLEQEIARLQKERTAILTEGPIAPEGVWIEYGRVPKRKFIQAYYRADKPIFYTNSTSSGLSSRKYIGKKDSEKDLSAQRAIARRNRLQELDRKIKLLKEKLEQLTRDNLHQYQL